MPPLSYGDDEEEVSTIAEEMKETFDLHVRRRVSDLSEQVDDLRQSLSQALLEKVGLEKELESERNLRNMYEGHLIAHGPSLQQQQQQPQPQQGRQPQTVSDMGGTARRLNIAPALPLPPPLHPQQQPARESSPASRPRTDSRGGRPPLSFQ